MFHDFQVSIAPAEMFRSVEAIWILWAVSVFGLVAMTWRGLKRLRASGLRKVMKNEVGAAYTLSLMMVIPIYLFFLCLTVETTLVLGAKSGTIYAAYQASRAATVYSSAEGWPTAQEKMQQAAVEAMMPFASGTQDRQQQLTESTAARRYLDAYQEYSGTSGNRNYMAAKYRFAEKAVHVTADGPPAEWHSDIKVQVTYDFPFNVPGIGRLLGTKRSDGNYYFAITSEATLQNEGPKNAAQLTGISYASPQ